MHIPLLYKVKQQFKTDTLRDVKGVVGRQIEQFRAGDKTRPGQTVAVAVASRGTHDLTALVAAVVERLLAVGLKPYIIPAMGSHGGATGPGQTQVLADLGISEETMGVPIVSNMDVVSLGRLDSGAEVFFSKDAFEADHVVVINRVKPHTLFRGEVESGICKIMAVGCGKQKGASNMHKFNLADTIVPAAKMILEKAPILFGVAVTENAAGGTENIRLARPEEFIDVDRESLKEAWELFPVLPVDDLDILVVDEMGKDVSGAGIDPNVIGFWRREGGPRKPDYRTLAVLDLTPKSHGNATGIGMADLVTQRLMDKLDLHATQMNSITTKMLRSARLPISLENDRLVLETALDCVPDPRRARMGRIRNTASLETFFVTENVLSELRSREGITIDDDPLQFNFDDQGNLLPFPY